MEIPAQVVRGDIGRTRAGEFSSSYFEFVHLPRNPILPFNFSTRTNKNFYKDIFFLRAYKRITLIVQMIK